MLGGGVATKNLLPPVFFYIIAFNSLTNLFDTFCVILIAFRAFRALRVLRTISFLENLQNVVNTLLKSIPAMGSITLLLVLVMYIFAIVGVHLYRDIYPERFGSIFIAIFSLFQLITLDDWFEFCDDVEDKDGGESMVAYLMIFIILETFIFVNLFIAVIVNNLQASQAQNSRKRKVKKKKKIMIKEYDLFIVWCN